MITLLFVTIYVALHCPYITAHFGIKTYFMRGLAYSTGAFFTSITILGILFKIMHWPGAGIVLVTGLAGLAIVAIPIYAIHKFRTSN